MRKIGLTIISVGSGLALIAMSMPATQAQESPAFAPPPSAELLVQATNAMMQPADLTGALAVPASGRIFATGFNNPPGGQDPFPACVVPTSNFRTIAIPDTLAVGFSARISPKDSTSQITQDVYQYPNDAAAQRAWTQLSAAIEKNCKGSVQRDFGSLTVTSTRIPGLPGGERGWGVLTTGSMPSYATIHQVSGGIQMITYSRYGDRPVPQVSAGARTAMNGLAGNLAQRWQGKATAPLTQSPALTAAEQSMLQPQDVPAALPIGTPAQGGWSTFGARTPAVSLQACNAAKDLPAAAQSFSVSYGGNGDVASMPGVIWQDIYQYRDAAQAAQVWRLFAQGASACSENPTGPIARKQDLTRIVNGVSALTFNGTPGIWVRTLQTSTSADFSFTTKSYTIYLLVDDTIQSLAYGPSIRKVAQIPLDQLTVNQLAETLANRWLAQQS
jgi:hypothetical protein